MKNFMITAMVALAVGCGKTGLDEKHNQQEKEHHENYQDSTDTDSTTGYYFRRKNIHREYACFQWLKDHEM